MVIAVSPPAAGTRAIAYASHRLIGSIPLTLAQCLHLIDHHV